MLWKEKRKGKKILSAVWVFDFLYCGSNIHLCIWYNYTLNQGWYWCGFVKTVIMPALNNNFDWNQICKFQTIIIICFDYRKGNVDV